MSSNVNWFVLEEEYTIGSAEVNGKDVFITEESIRFDAPRVMIHETLEEAVMQICFFGHADEFLENPEERRYFKKELKRVEKAYKKAKEE